MAKGKSISTSGFALILSSATPSEYGAAGEPLP